MEDASGGRGCKGKKKNQCRITTANEKWLEACRHVQTREQQRGDGPDLKLSLGVVTKMLTVRFPARDPSSCLDLTSIFWPRSSGLANENVSVPQPGRGDAKPSLPIASAHPPLGCLNVSITWINNSSRAVAFWEHDSHVSIRQVH